MKIVKRNYRKPMLKDPPISPTPTPTPTNRQHYRIRDAVVVCKLFSTHNRAERC